MFKQIRHPLPKDALQITELGEEAFGKDTGIALPKIFITLAIYLYNDTFLVAVDESDNVIGCVLVLPNQAHPGRFWAMNFVVHQDYRGTGIGGQLIAEIGHILRSRPEVKRVELTVHPENNRTRMKYMSWGFELGELIEDFYGPGQPRYLMHMDLDKTGSQN